MDFFNEQPTVGDIVPVNGNSKFHFNFNDIHNVEIEYQPLSEAMKGAIGWDNAIRELSRHIEFISLKQIWCPYPVFSFCIGAGETTDVSFHVRFFLFPVHKPQYQNQAIAQVIFEAKYAAKSENISSWVDALHEDELSPENIHEIIKGTQHYKLKYLLKKYPAKFRYFKDENEFEKINFDNIDLNSEHIFNNFNSKIIDFVCSEIELGKEVAIQAAGNEKILIHSAFGLFKR